jgi:hypothetical protein
MKIYLAGGVTGNLISFWKCAMKIYLAGTYSRLYVIEESMKLYLAGIQGKAKDFVLKDQNPYILESFFYIRSQHEWVLKMKPFFSSFLLDSGAFTFMQGSGGTPNWDTYTEEYARFINKHDINYFFELDIDSIVGIKEVERLREKLETMTNKKCIPVWHKSRGLDYWKKMIAEYDYVAIGGIVSKEIKQTEYDIFLPLLKLAKENNCKVHGLGFTNLERLKRYPFYSVDSTAWLYGNRGGFLYQFNGTTMEKIQPKGKRLKGGGRLAAINNFNEWVKFSRYADNNL